MGSTVFPAAATGPTLSEITTAGTSAGWGATGGSWTYLQTFTANNSGTISFTGLSGYSKYKIVGAMSAGTYGTRRLRINNDSSNLYSYSYGLEYSGLTTPLDYYASSYNADNHFPIGYSSGGTNFSCNLIISNANSSGIKLIESENIYLDGRWNLRKLTGTYEGTSTVSSIYISSAADGGTFTSGKLYLFGGN